MFSSFSRYLSPKQLLANQLSKFLAEFFDVDPGRIETNLVQDAKVVLNQILLKQRQVGQLVIHGQVKRIEFSWTWDSASLITNVNLKIEGVEIHVTLEENIESAESTNSPITDHAPSEPASSDWKAKYFQQIIDHLTVLVTDVEIVVDLPAPSQSQQQLVLVGNGMEIRALHGHASSSAAAILEQILRVESLAAWIRSGEIKYPLLDPFGYQATVQRIAGRRFLDGITTGLSIQGEANDSSKIRVHAGVNQVSALGHLQQVLLSIAIDTNGDNGSNSNSNSNSDSDSQTNPLSESTVQVEKRKEDVSLQSRAPSDTIGSTFSLPLQSIAVVLDNDTHIQLASCIIRYCTDGSELSVECTEGLWMDTTRLLSGRCMVDLVHSQVILDAVETVQAAHSEQDDSEQEQGNTVWINLSVGMLRVVYSGIQAILPQVQEAVALVENENIIEASSTEWTVNVNKNLGIRFKGMHEESVEAKIQSPQVTIQSSGLFTLAWKEMNIGPTSFGHFALHIPSIQTVDQTLILQDSVEISLGSFQVAHQLQTLWKQVEDTFTGDSSESGVEFPMAIGIPNLNLAIEEPESPGAVKLSDIKISSSSLDVGTLQILGFGGMVVDASIIKANMAMQKMTVQIQEISKASLAQVGHLSEPLLHTFITVEKDGAAMSCQTLHFNYHTASDVETSTGGRHLDEISLESILPFPVKCVVKQLIVSSGQPQLIACDLVTIELKPETELLSVHLHCAAIQADLSNILKTKCTEIEASATFIPRHKALASTAGIIEIPGLGRLSSATGRFQEIAEISIPTIGDLVKSINESSITFEDERISIHLDTIQFEVSKLAAESDNDSKPPSSSGDVEIISGIHSELCVPVDIAVKRLQVMPEFAAGKPGICADVLQIRLEPTGQLGALRIYGKCFYLQARGPKQSELAAKRTTIESLLIMSSPETGLGLSKVTLSVQEISKFSIPNVVELSKSLCNITAVFEDESLNACCKELHLTYHTEGLSEDTRIEFMGATIAEPNHAPIKSKSKLAPIPMRFTVERLVASSITSLPSGYSEQAVELQGFDIEVNPLSKGARTSAAKMNCRDMKARHSKFGSGAFAGITASVEFKAECTGPQLLVLPGWGELSLGSLNVDAITDLRIENIGHFKKPLYNSIITMCDKAVSVDLDTIEFEAPCIFTGGGESGMSSDTIDFTLEIPIHFTLKRLVLMEDFQTNQNRLSVDTLRIDIDVTSMDGQTHLLVHGDVLDMHGPDDSCVKVAGMEFRAIRSSSSRLHITGALSSPLSFPGIGLLHMATLELDEISDVHVSNIAHLVQPVQDFSAFLQHGALNIRLESPVYLAVPGLYQPGKDCEPKKSTNIEAPAFSMKIPLHLSMKRIVVMPTFEVGDPGICCDSVLMDLSPVIEQYKYAKLRIYCEALQALGEGPLCLLVPSLEMEAKIKPGPRDPKATDKSSLFLEIPGLGHIVVATISAPSVSSLAIPGFGTLNQEMKDFVMSFGEKGVDVNCGIIDWSMASGEHSAATGAPTNTLEYASFFPIQVCVQGLIIKIGGKEAEQWLRCDTGVEFELKSDLRGSFDICVTCSAMHGYGLNDLSMSLDGLEMRATFKPIVHAENSQTSFALLGLSNGRIYLNELSALCLPSIGMLSAPSRKVQVHFEKDALVVQSESISLIKASPQLSPPSTGETSRADTFELPCPVQILVQDISVSEASIGESVEDLFTCRHFNAKLEPMPRKFSALSSAQGRRTTLVARCKDLEYSKKFRTPSLSVSAQIDFDDLDTVHSLTVGLDRAELREDLISAFSSKLQDSSPLKLPFAKVQNFEFTLICGGKMARINDTRLHLKGFEGNETTDSDTLTKFYVAIVKQRIPYLITQAEVAGANIGDSIGMVAGRAVMSSSVVGSMVGIGARDAVGGALSMGKNSRGASETEKYRFGDFSRGLLASAKGAAESGAHIRGDDKYAVGDFTAGTIQAAGEYASKNRVRFGGAGGASLGMIAGTIIAGPIGLIAGSMLGSSAGQASVRMVAGDPSRNTKDPPSSDGSTENQKLGRSIDNTQYPENPVAQVQAPDLLSAPNSSRDDTNLSQSNYGINRTSQPYSNNMELVQATVSSEAGAISSHREPPFAFAPTVQERRPHQTQPRESFPQRPYYSENITSPQQVGPTPVYGSNQYAAATSPQIHLNASPHQAIASSPVYEAYHSPGQAAPYQGNSSLGTNSYSTTPVYGSNQYAAATSPQIRPNAPGQAAPHQGHSSLVTNSYSTTPVYGSNQCAAVTSPKIHPNASPHQAMASSPVYESYHSPGQAAPYQGHSSLGNNSYSTQQHSARHYDPQPEPNRENQEGYIFGDIGRGIVSRGKQLDGRDQKSGYKFGDFTRGLFK